MQLSSILAQIPILRNFTSQSLVKDNQEGTQGQVSSPAGQTEESLRQQAIEDTVDISVQASQALADIDSRSELPDEEVSKLVEQVRFSLESNDNLNIGLNPSQARGL